MYQNIQNGEPISVEVEQLEEELEVLDYLKSKNSSFEEVLDRIEKRLKLEHSSLQLVTRIN